MQTLCENVTTIKVTLTHHLTGLYGPGGRVLVSGPKYTTASFPVLGSCQS